MKSSYKKMSFLSIITFVGVLLLQAFWIMDSYTERQAHFKEHIHNVLDEVSKDYCQSQTKIHSSDTAIYEKERMDSILNLKLIQIQELSNYQFEIADQNSKRNIKLEKKKHFHFTEDLKCANGYNKTLHLYILNDKSYFISSILSWVILSSLLIIISIVALFYNLSFLRQQKKMAQIKSDFISNMTHELKTPIATISVASEMLMNDKVIDDRKKANRYATIIHEENLRLKKLVNRVMQIALFENGTMRISIKELDVHKYIEQSVKAIKMIIDKREGQINTQLEAQSSIYQLDPSHFRNIITNLMENAIKYSKGKPEISISTVDYSEGILISIEDKGIGIEKKYIDKIFNQFFRVETGNVHNTKGFGLGLYYVRRIVEAHGGTIKVYSTIGEGSRFEIYFPRL